MPDTAPQAGNGATPEDETKRKFREALERKQAKAKAGAAHQDAGPANAHAHGPAAQKRNFRRKSG
ncbi:DUF5302 domain-containing protein [Prauserella muralis]|uniref:Uncharacterized protein n=1 Tax=Prauserella muralis TaxID=588067 RepID=A0A2V4AL33_9PSEU|nr:DUF5302 domain-containing protein [Prauserella muralis]PXY20674.1 hypothetical protein BAY60_24355 [Prauserella muralis]TWE29668.1 hypothetical protein FHX69_2355 [Prauserella muralis]